jgi:MFS family permease
MPAAGLLSWLRTDTWLLLALGPLVAFFGTGFFSGFGTVTAEIYPTSVRAMAQGFTFNMGRLGSAVAPFFVGRWPKLAGLARRLPSWRLRSCSERRHGSGCLKPVGEVWQLEKYWC